MTPSADAIETTPPASGRSEPASPPDAVRATNVTMVGTLQSELLASVDPSGGVVAGMGRPVIDWWVGAEDRWHDPRTSKAVRRRLIGNAPVVETAMHVPGGDVIHRVFAVPATPEGADRGAGDAPAVVVIEVENRSAVPVAVALAVRPSGAAGVGLSHLVLRSGVDDRTAPWAEVLADGVPALRLNRLPAHVCLAAAAMAEPDAFATVTAGRAEARTGHDAAEVTCAAGAANGAFVFPLSHTAVLRAVVPIAAGPPPRRSRSVLGRARGRAGVVPPGAVPPRATIAWPDPLPSPDQVARGWAVHAEQGARFVVPAGRWPDQLERAHLALLLWSATGASAIPPTGAIDPAEVALMAVALDELGHHEQAAGLVREVFDRQALDGSFGAGPDRLDTTALALAAAGTHAMLAPAPDPELLAAIVGPVAKAGHWLHRRAGRGNGVRPDSRAGDAHPDPVALVALVALGLRRGAALLQRAEQPDAADRLAQFARERRDGAGAGAGAPGDPDVPGDRGVPGVAAVAWRDSVSVVERLAAGAPCAGSPALGASLAAHHVRHALVREGDADDQLVLVADLPAAWLGQGIEVHRAPTALGPISFAVRWHGERPALLWELDGLTAAGGVPSPSPLVLTAPGLDPTWSTSAPKGEALLAAPRTDDPPAAQGGSFT